MKHIDIVYKDIDKLKSYEKNPRLNDEAVPLVAKSIEEFGMKVPIVVDTDNVIVCGHTRVKALKQLGETEVPCIIADDLSPDQIKAFRLADNKVAEAAGWDFELLDAELDSLIDGFDMEDFGFILEDFDTIEYDGDSEDSLEEDEVNVRDKKEPLESIPEEEPVPDVKTAIRRDDRIKLGRHTLFCKDALEENLYTRDDYADLSLMTPPWIDNPADDIESLTFKCYNSSKVTVVCAPWGMAPQRIFTTLKELWVSQFIYWETDVPIAGEDEYHLSHQVHPIPIITRHSDGVMPIAVDGWSGLIKGVCPKSLSSTPLYLATEIIEHLSPEGGLVFDPYGGSGTVLIACEDTGRTCEMMEADPAACEMIVRRYIERVGSAEGIELIRDGVVMETDWN